MKRKPRQPRRKAQLVPIADVQHDRVRCILETAPIGVVLTILPQGEARLGFAGEAQTVLAAIDRYLAPGRVRSAALFTILRFAYAESEAKAG